MMTDRTVRNGPTSVEGVTIPHPVNWTLLNRLQAERRPHPYWDPTVPLPPGASVSVGEAVEQVGIAHHVLDLTGIPALPGYGHDIDARVLQLVIAYQDATYRLSRLASIHARETGDHGTVGDFCTECGWRWPCHSHQIATNTILDADQTGDDS